MAFLINCYSVVGTSSEKGDVSRLCDIIGIGNVTKTGCNVRGLNYESVGSAAEPLLWLAIGQ